MQTNSTLTMKRIATDWKQQETTTTIGTYDVWLEESAVEKWMKEEGKGLVHVIGKGTIIFLDDIDLVDAIFELDSIRYDICDSGKFLDQKGNFHHIEAYYK